jgi:hypothetical protein
LDEENEILRMEREQIAADNAAANATANAIANAASEDKREEEEKVWKEKEAAVMVAVVAEQKRVQEKEASPLLHQC